MRKGGEKEKTDIICRYKQETNNLKIHNNNDVKRKTEYLKM